MKEPIQLWTHQKKAVEKARGKSSLALFFEMGTGKTATTIHILRELYQKEGRLMRTLILCPPIVIQNWKKEFSIHSKIKPQDIVPIVGTGASRFTKLNTEAFNGGSSNGKILITNYETLLMEPIFHLLKTWGLEILVCDESHKLKESKAKRSVKAKELSDLAQFKYILTGTPVLNSPMDLFSQYRVLDGGKTFGTNFFIFRHQYFYDKNERMPAHRHFPNWTVKPGALDQIKNKLEATGMSIKKSECLDLPPLVRKVFTVSLGKEQGRAYEQMKKDFITFIQDDACVATLAITKALRLQQIISGHLPVGEEPGTEKVHVFKENPRLEAVKEILEEVTQHSKILVWAVFREDFKQLAKICKELEIKYVEVHGEITAKKKDEAVTDFNSPGGPSVFIGHPGSGGIGINLTAASYSLFYSRNFSLENDLQADARNHRGGSEIHEKITRIDLVAEDTLDELILERLKNKQNIGEAMLREMAKELNGSKTNDSGRIRETPRRSLSTKTRSAGT